MTAVSSDVTYQTLTGRKPDDVFASAASISKLSIIRLTAPRECGDKSADDSLNGDDSGVRPQRKQKLCLITLICSPVQQEPALAAASAL